MVSTARRESGEYRGDAPPPRSRGVSSLGGNDSVRGGVVPASLLYLSGVGSAERLLAAHEEKIARADLLYGDYPRESLSGTTTPSPPPSLSACSSLSALTTADSDGSRHSRNSLPTFGSSDFDGTPLTTSPLNTSGGVFGRQIPRGTGGLVDNLLDAAANGEAGMCQMYLASGADVVIDDRGADGDSALFVALRNGFSSVARVLLACGAEVGQRDVAGRTPLMYARVGVAGVLLSSGADVNAQDNDGQTALMLACQAQDAPKTRLLLRHGALCNLPDHSGMHALSDACRYGWTEGVHILLTAGASITSVDAHGMSAAAHAEDHGHIAIRDILLEKR